MASSELQRHAEERRGTTVADAYLLERLIGIGGTAAVYEATAMDGSHVAVKMLHRSASRVPGARERFRGEAVIARKIQHPGVVQIFDEGVSRDGDLYLVMELLEGQAIDKRLKKAGGVLPLSEVLAITSAALGVLCAAHEAGIVHRDLKPENLFLTTSRSLKVLDFGIAKLTGPQSFKRSQAGVVMGTPAFMAPEQARTTGGEVDRRTDVWAMGAFMFTALSGRPVHDGSDAREVMAAAATRPAPSLARVMASAPPPIVHLVDRALAFDKDERFEDAATMRAALRSAGREVTANVTPSPPVPAVKQATPYRRPRVQKRHGGA